MSVLGEALAPPQLAIAGASVAVWFLVQHCLVSPLLVWRFGHELWRTRDAGVKRQCLISVTSGLFSVVAVCIGSLGLLFPGPAVAADPIYGRSDSLQHAFALVAGFFAWNTIADMVAGASIGNRVHHVCCMVIYLVLQTPFCPRIGCILLLFEASTPFLVTFNVLRTFELEDSSGYRTARTMFAVLFILVRIVIGIPLTIGWYSDMFALLSDRSREVHSMSIVRATMVAPVLFYAVNFHWLAIIVRGIVQKSKPRP